jgi:hypothetical protein
MTVVIAQDLEHAQTIIKALIVSGQYDVARKVGTDNGVPPSWVEKRIEVWDKYRTWKSEEEAKSEPKPKSIFAALWQRRLEAEKNLADPTCGGV